MLPIEIQRAEVLKPRLPDGELGFGRVFTDHMFVMEYEPAAGWHRPRIMPYGPLVLDPAAAVFHYGQAMFEGLKAFRNRAGAVRLFRPDQHARRLAVGAERLCMPSPDSETFVQALLKLIEVDQAWVPSSTGTALYVRPTLIASEPFLGVRASTRYLFFVILSPVGPYYAEGLDPVKIWIEERFVRAARGGLGAIKAGANYAASLLAATEAKEKGYAQVLWLDAKEHRFLEEVGTMNLFVRIGDEVITPPLEGSILAGVTRDTVLSLLKEWGARASERPLSIDELLAAHRAGTLKEVFGSGTAAVISPVGQLRLGSERIVIQEGQIGEVARHLFDAISGIHYGDLPDPHGWMVPLPV
jgi:branched-chain amino acid aminotransferase